MSTQEHDLLRRLREYDAQEPSEERKHPMIGRLSEADPTLRDRAEVTVGRIGSAIARQGRRIRDAATAESSLPEPSEDVDVLDRPEPWTVRNRRRRPELPDSFDVTPASPDATRVDTPTDLPSRRDGLRLPPRPEGEPPSEVEVIEEEIEDLQRERQAAALESPPESPPPKKTGEERRRRAGDLLSKVKDAFTLDPDERIESPGFIDAGGVTAPEEQEFSDENRAAEILKSGGRGLAAGTLSLGEAVGTGMMYLGNKNGEADLVTQGRQVQEYWKNKGKAFQIDPELEGLIAEDPSLILNPEWLAYQVGDMAPSVAVSMIPGVGAAKYIQLGGQALKWSPQLVSRLAKLGGMIAGGAAGGSLEGVHTYQEILELTGGDADRAAKAGELMTLASGALNALSVGRALKPGAWSSIVRFLQTGSIEALTEYAEEPAEALIKMGVVPDEFTPEMAFAQMRAGLNVIPGAFITGGLAGMATGSRPTEGTDLAPGTLPPGDGGVDSPYNVLGVSEDATDAEIETAFRDKAREVHPDVNPDPEATELFQELEAARRAIRVYRAWEQERAQRAEEPVQEEPTTEPAAEPEPAGARAPDSEAYEEAHPLLQRLRQITPPGEEDGTPAAPEEEIQAPRPHGRKARIVPTRGPASETEIRTEEFTQDPVRPEGVVPGQRAQITKVSEEDDFDLFEPGDIVTVDRIDDAAGTADVMVDFGEPRGLERFSDIPLNVLEAAPEAAPDAPVELTGPTPAGESGAELMAKAVPAYEGDPTGLEAHARERGEREKRIEELSAKAKDITSEERDELGNLFKEEALDLDETGGQEFTGQREADPYESTVSYPEQFTKSSGRGESADEGPWVTKGDARTEARRDVLVAWALESGKSLLAGALRTRRGPDTVNRIWFDMQGDVNEVLQPYIDRWKSGDLQAREEGPIPQQEADAEADDDAAGDVGEVRERAPEYNPKPTAADLVLPSKVTDTAIGPVRTFNRRVGPLLEHWRTFGHTEQSMGFKHLYTADDAANVRGEFVTPKHVASFSATLFAGMEPRGADVLHVEELQGRYRIRMTDDSRSIYHTDDREEAVEIARSVAEGLAETQPGIEEIERDLLALKAEAGVVRERSRAFWSESDRDVGRHLTSTFGSLEEAAKVVREVQDAGGDLVQASGLVPVPERKAAVEAGKEAFASVPATGQKVANRDALFRLLRAYRHPTAEYWHVLVLGPNKKGQREVVHHRMTSSGALDVGLVNMGDMVEAAAIAKKVGGQVVLSHNHPSGNPTPSPEDMAVTRESVRNIQKVGAEYGGHLVINGEDFVVIDDRGQLERLHVPDRRKKHQEWNRPNPKRIRNDTDVFGYLANLPHDKNRIDVLYLNTQHEVIAFEPRPRRDMESVAEWMPAEVRDLGARVVVIGTYGMFPQRYVLDKVGASGFPVLDVVDIENRKSATELPDNPLRGGTGPTMVPLFEEEATYGEETEVQREGRRGRRDRGASDTRTIREEQPEYGDVNKPGESKVQQEERLEKNRRRLQSLAERVEASKSLSKKVRAKARRALARSLIPRQAVDILADLKEADTPRQARNAIRRGQRLIERELHRRALTELQNVLRRANKMKLRPEFLEKIEAVTADIDTKAMSAKTRRMLRATAKYLEKNPEAPVPDHVRRELSRLDKKSVRKLSVDELRAITDAVRAAVHLNRTKNRLLGKRRRQSRDRIAARAIEQMRKRAKKLKRGKGPGGLEGPPKRSRIGLFLKEVGTRPEVLLEHLSPTMQRLVYEDITVQAHAEEQRMVWEFRDALAESVQSVGQKMGTKKFEEWRTTPLTLETADGAVEINRDEAIWLLTTIKDPSNAALMHANGVTLDRSERTFTWDDEAHESLMEITGDEERKVARDLFKQFNGPMKEALNEAWVDVYGYEIAKVPEYAPRSIDMDRADTGKDPLEQMAVDREAALTTWGHLRERVGARAPLKIGSALDTFNNHAEHVARLSAYLAPATNAHVILGRADVKQAMMERVGKDGYERIISSLNMQTVRQADKTTFERWTRLRLRMFGGSVLSLRATTLGLNPSGLAISAGYQRNGFRNLARALRHGFNPGHWRRVSRLAKKHSPYWRSRYESFVHQSTSGLANERSRHYGRPDLAEIGLKPLEKSDQFGAVVRWRMAEYHVKRTKKHLEEGSDEFYEAVAREWERLMFRGENTAHGGDMTGAIAFGRRKVFWAPFVMFTSSVSKIYSLGVRAALAAQRGERRKAIASLAGVIGSLAWAALVREFFSRGDDDDEGYLKRLATRMATEAAGVVTAPVSAIITPAIKALAGKRAPVFTANVADDVLTDIGTTVVQSIRTVEKGVSGELDAQGNKVWPEHFNRTVDDVLNLTAMWFGAPYSGPKALYDRFLSDSTDLSLRSQLRDLEEESDVTQERRELMRAIRFNDPTMFRGAVSAMREKGTKVDYREVLATVNRRYGFLTKYEEGKPDRSDLGARELELVDQHLMERDELRDMALRLARENRDVLDARPRRGRGRRRPRRRTRRPRRRTRRPRR